MFNESLVIYLIDNELFYLILWIIIFMRLLGILASGIISIVIFFELSANKFDDPNKDKLLVELVSVVLDRLHYDPKIIDDEFLKKCI